MTPIQQAVNTIMAGLTFSLEKTLSPKDYGDFIEALQNEAGDWYVEWLKKWFEETPSDG